VAGCQNLFEGLLDKTNPDTEDMILLAMTSDANVAGVAYGERALVFFPTLDLEDF
jgi:hypothetical protein